MRFSILLPTRNRLSYLKYAVETVRRQDYDDWEIVISDNCSEEDVSGYVRKMADSRIRYFRTEKIIPVTDNWNNAIEKSLGDYVIMLGDDDGLVNGYFSSMNRLIEQFSEPDTVYTSGFLYAYPRVIPGHPNGYLIENRPTFMKYSSKPFFLERRLATRMVKDAFHFIVRFGCNMQYSTIKREFVRSLSQRGRFFQSPFPDFYATNVLFLKARSIVINPNPVVIIGITPKSYGYFLYNSRENEGAEFLGNEDPSLRRSSLLPGSNMNSWLAAMEAVYANYGSEFGFQVDYGRHRSLQILRMLESYYLKKTCSRENYLKFRNRMLPQERFVYGKAISLATLLEPILRISRPFSLTRFLFGKWYQLLGQAPSKFNQRFYPGRYENILQLFENVAAGNA